MFPTTFAFPTMIAAYQVRQTVKICILKLIKRTSKRNFVFVILLKGIKNFFFDFWIYSPFNLDGISNQTQM